VRINYLLATRHRFRNSVHYRCIKTLNLLNNPHKKHISLSNFNRNVGYRQTANTVLDTDRAGYTASQPIQESDLRGK